MKRGDYLSAARAFEQLYQQTDGVEADRHLMRSILAYIDAGEVQTATDLLPPEPINDSVAERLQTLAEVALSERKVNELGMTSFEPEMGLGEKEKLEQVEPGNLTPYQKGFYYRLLANALAQDSARSDKQEEVVALLNADRYPLPAVERTRVHRRIWHNLNQLSSEQRLSLSSRTDRNGQAWLELAGAVRPVMHDNVQLQAAVSAWQIEYPTHSANETFIEELFETAESLSATIRHIGLLLPFEGRYGKAAQAIRNGFLSAWFDDPKNSGRPIVSVYTVNSANVVAQYTTAITNGADLIVGPLEKTTIETLLSSPNLDKPILVLNELPDAKVAELQQLLDASEEATFSFDKLYQFGLSPEAEALAIAERARRDGINRIVTITPNSNLGNRIGDAYLAAWLRFGGQALGTIQYDDSDEKFVNAVRLAFSLDRSEARAQRLTESLNRRLFFEPRPRRDVDALLVAGFPVDNRQLVPQLRYFRVADVPVYATSHTFGGRLNVENDRDLDGMIFGDMPWVLGDADQGAINAYRKSWPGAPPNATRMFAFGMDAYRLSAQLARLRYQTGLHIPGATGILSISADGKVRRQISFAKFVDGVPTLVHGAR